MKQLLRFALITLSCSLLIPGCDKKNDDDGFFVEAVINGQQWKGKASSGFIATNASDNSAIHIDISGLNTGSYTFFTNPSPGDGGSTNLPGVVHLAYMNLAAFDSKLVLRWSSLFETNIAKYEVQRATKGDPNTYYTLGEVNAQGTSTTQVDYSVNVSTVDPFPLLNGYYYRVKIIKSDNSFVFSAVRLIGGLRYTSSPMISFMKNGRIFYCLDNNQNQLTITSADMNSSGPRKGTFSFRYKDENGNIVNVTNGRFHLGNL